MKLVLVIAALSSGGAERVLTDMANYWQKIGWDITLITIYGSEVEDFYELHTDIKRLRLNLGQPTIGILAKMMVNVKRIKALRDAIKQVKPDAVISFIDITNILTIIATRGLKLKVVVSERINPAVNYNISTGWRFLRYIFYRFAYRVVAQTNTTASWIVKYCNAKVVNIPNHIREMPVFDEERLNIVVSVGRLDKQKGHDVLVKAFSKTSATFPNWRLIICGDGVERVSLESLRDSLGLLNSVQFLGVVKDVETWFSRAGLIVQASRFEGFPNVLLEAMSMGAAVISTDCLSGPSDIIQNGENGRLVPVDDVDYLSKVMAELMGNAKLRCTLGQSAKSVRVKYSQAVVMCQWNTILNGESV